MLNEHISDNIRANRVHSGILIIGMAGILSLLGFVLGGWLGLSIAIGLCIGLMLFGPRASPQLILRMYKASELSPHAAPELFAIFSAVVQRAELSQSPKLYYIPSRTLNAFAVGNKQDSAVAITDGLLRILNPREIAGVLAHEVSHIRHRDISVMGIADTVSRITGSLSQLGQLMLFLAIPAFLMRGGVFMLVIAVLMIFAPMISNLMQLALSRAREFNADLGAVSLTGDAAGLASALHKLERITSGRGGFPWIFAGRKRETVPAMLRTHPPTEERIRRILEAGQSLLKDVQTLNEANLVDRNDIPRERIVPETRARVRRGPSWHAFGLWY